MAEVPEIGSSPCETLKRALFNERMLNMGVDQSSADAARYFKNFKYVVCSSMLSESTSRFLLHYALDRALTGEMNMNDGQVPQTPAQYADPMTELLLDKLCPVVERLTDLLLFPTYSYMRVYKKGDVLKPHRDRVACEVSLTLTLGFDAPHPWPIYIESQKRARSVVIGPGDAMIYRGIECMHWRDVFEGSYAAQVFLHYVDQRGPYAAHRFDRRPQLNHHGDIRE